MSDLTGDLDTLRDESDVLLQRATDAQGRLAPIKAQDSTGQVVVQLDADGKLQSVQIGFTWDQSLTGTGLPAAVLEAIAQARVIRLEQYAQAVKEVDEEPAPRARPARHDTPLIDMFRERIAARGGDPEAAGELVEEMLDDASEGLTEANQLLEDHLARHHTGRSAAGHVTATVTTNGDPQAIELDARWIPNAHSANLGREITQAIQAAVEKAQREGFSAVLRATKLAQVARLVTDPDTARTYRRETP